MDLSNYVGYIVDKKPALGINPHIYDLTLVFKTSASAKEEAANAIVPIELAGLRLVYVYNKYYI